MKDQEDDIKNIYLKLKGGMLDFKGNSMEPFLKEGDRVKVEPVPPYSIRPGDIIVFNAGSALACHRIVAKFRRHYKFYFWEKGDNNGRIRVISEDEIVGRVRYMVRGGIIRQTGIFVSMENVFFHLLNMAIYPYLVFSGFVKKYIFFGRKNFISHVFGTLVWKMYNFLFRAVEKGKYVCNRDM